MGAALPPPTPYFLKVLLGQLASAAANIAAAEAFAAAADFSDGNLGPDTSYQHLPKSLGPLGGPGGPWGALGGALGGPGGPWGGPGGPWGPWAPLGPWGPIFLILGYPRYSYPLFYTHDPFGMEFSPAGFLKLSGVPLEAEADSWGRHLGL